MILRRALLALAAISGLATCAAGLTVALVLSAFTALEPRFGPLFAASLLALGLAVSLAVAALIFGRKLLLEDRRAPAQGLAGLAESLAAGPGLATVLVLGARGVAKSSPAILRACLRIVSKRRSRR